MTLNVVLEGIDNAGKTTIAEAISHHISHHGFNCAVTKELTTSVGHLVQKSFNNNEPLSPKMKTLLFAGDRLSRFEELQHDVDVIIWDRYFYSAVVYRTVEDIDQSWVRCVNKIFPEPDLAFYLDITPETSRTRANGKACPYSEEFLSKCRNGYLKLVSDGELLKIDGSIALDELVLAISNQIMERLIKI